MPPEARETNNQNSDAPSQETSGDVTDQIADLLSGDESSTDSNDEETQTGESNELREETSNEETNEESNEDNGNEEASEEGQEAESWLDVLGVEEDKLSFEDNGNIKGINIKVNGETSTVPMAELIAGYQTNKSVTQKSQSLAEERKSFDGQKAKVESLYKDKLETAEALSSYFEKQLISEFDGINWEQLRVDNPAEYAAARQDYAAKANELQGIKVDLSNEKNGVIAHSNQQNQAAFQQHLKIEFDKMLEKNPTWTDESVRKTDMNGYKSFMTDSYGFTDADMNAISDSRIIEVIKDARKFREGAKIGSAKAKKPVPKFQKSRGKASKAKASKLDKLTSASRKAQGSEKRDLQKSAIAELLMNG